MLSYIKIFLDCLETMEPLDDGERGRLFTALLQYAKTGQIPALQGNERFLFPVLRAQLDRDAQSYQRVCQANRENGRLGGRPPRNPASFPQTQEKDQEKEQEKEKGKEKDRSSSRTSTGGKRRSRRESQDSPQQIRRDMDAMDALLQQMRREMAQQASHSPASTPLPQNGLDM